MSKKSLKDFLSKPFVPPFILVIISVISHIEWFNWNSVLFYGDWQHRTGEVVSQITNFGRATWLGDTGLGCANIQVNTFINTYVWGLIGNYDIAVKITHLIPIALLSVLAPYYLLRYITKNKSISFLGALLYGFNTYIIMRSTAHLPIAFVFSLTPLIILFFIKLLKNFSLRNAVCFALIYSLGCFYEIRIMYIVTFILFVYLMVFYGIRQNWKNKYRYLLLAFLIILINLLWILPVFFMDRQDFNEVINRGLWGDNLFSLKYALSFFASRWTGGSLDNAFIAHAISIFSWSIPIIATLSLIYYKGASKDDRKYVTFFAIILFVGLFLTKQSGEPFGGIYLWLYQYFPGFSLFREASKFYLLLGVGYLGLFAFGLKYLSTIISKKLIKNIIYVCLLVLLLVNIKPLVTKEIGALFVNRIEPSDYMLLDKKMSKDTQFYRTLWAPITSQWSYYDNNHPKISMWDLLTDQNTGFGSFSNVPVTINNFDNPKLYSNIFQSSYGKDLLNKLSVRYVIIPLQLPESEDRIFPYAGDRQVYVNEFDKSPYLKKINIGTKDLAVYENKDYNSHITALDNIVRTDSVNDIRSEGEFLDNTKRAGADFVIGDGDNFKFDKLTSLFVVADNITLTKNPSLISQNLNNININSVSTLYKNISKRDLYYSTSAGKLTIYTKSYDNPQYNDIKLNFDNETEQENITTVEYKNVNNLYIVFGTEVTPVKSDATVNLGSAGSRDSFSIITTEPTNVINNGSFEEGVWEDKVGDCNNYDTNSILGMNVDKEQSGNHLLRLEATRHIACTSTDINVKQDDSDLFSFDYKGINAKQAGFYISFNDSKKTTISKKLAINSGSWGTYSSVLHTPHGATSARLHLYSYESGNNSPNVNLYDNVSMRKISVKKDIEIPKMITDKFTSIKLMAEKGKNNIAIDNSQNGKNLVSNPSFESGTWTNKVFDCWAYDGNSNISQSIRTIGAEDSRKFLELGAIKHNACTNTVINIPQSGNYYLSFYYRSVSAEKMGYYLWFNDNKKSNYGEKVITNDNEWHKFSTIVAAPNGATMATLYVYSYESDGKINNVVDYDNFSFIKVPDLTNTYYLMTEGDKNLAKPGKISYSTINPTKHDVKVSMSSKPFVLSFSENYDAGWHVYLQKINSDQTCKQTQSIGNLQCVGGFRDAINDIRLIKHRYQMNTT